MRNLSYKKVDEHKSGVLCLILSLHSLEKKKKSGKKCIICIITVTIDNPVIFFRL